MRLRRPAPVRLVAVGGLLAVGIVTAGCGSGSTSTAPASPVTTSDASGAPVAASSGGPSSAAPSSTAPPTPTPTPSEPGGGTTLLPGHRFVAFYGAADTPALGVLGDSSAEGIWPRLAQQAAAYKTSDTPVVPTYELIADVIQAAPGADGDYSVQVSDATIDSYVAAAKKHDAMLILDIQPGRTSFPVLAKKLTKYLELPDVGLALDPEWRLTGTQVPDAQIGTVTAAEINQTSQWLQDLTVQHHLPQKMLLIHQFTDDEIQDKAAVARRPDLATVFNMDGFGGRAAKLSKYKDLASDTRFGLGLKLFYKQDVDIFSPAEVLKLSPAPDVVDYE